MKRAQCHHYWWPTTFDYGYTCLHCGAPGTWIATVNTTPTPGPFQQSTSTGALKW